MWLCVSVRAHVCETVKIEDVGGLQLIIAGPARSPYHAHAVTHSHGATAVLAQQPRRGWLVNTEKLILSP